MNKTKKSKLAKKLNLISFIYILIQCLIEGILLYCDSYYVERFNKNNNDIFASSLLHNSNFFIMTIVINSLICVFFVLFIIITCFLKKDYKIRRKSLFIGYISIIKIVGTITILCIIPNIINNLSNEIIYLITLISNLIGLIITIILLIISIKISKQIKQERILQVKAIKEEKRNIKNKINKEKKIIKEQLIQEKALKKEKQLEEKEALIREKEKINQKRKQTKEENIKSKQLLKEQKIKEKNNLPKVNKTQNKITNENFFNYFKCLPFSIMQKVSIVLSIIGGFGCMMLISMFEQSRINNEDLSTAYKNNLTPLIIMISLSVIFIIGLICGIIFTILKNVQKAHAYQYFKEHREEIETDENIKNNYSTYKMMVKDYTTIYGLFIGKTNKKVTSAYNILTILYGLMFIIDILGAFYFSKETAYINGNDGIAIFLLSFICCSLITIYLEIFIERIFKQKTYYVKGSMYLKNNKIDGDLDWNFVDFINQEPSLNKYAKKLGNKKGWFSYIFAFPSSAILVGLPLIFILVVIFLFMTLIYMILKIFDIQPSYTSNSSSYKQTEDENIHGYNGQDQIIFKDITTATIIPESGILIDANSGKEYRIYNYHSNSGYFEDENGNVYYNCLNNEFIITNDYRHYGESEYEADNRIKKDVGFTR